MFDEYHSHRHNHRYDVTEKRAPTDESVRLLKEMQDKVKETFLGSVSLTNSTFDGRIGIFREMSSDAYAFHFQVKLAGKEKKFSSIIDAYKIRSMSTEQIITHILKEIADWLAHVLFVELLETNNEMKQFADILYKAKFG